MVSSGEWWRLVTSGFLHASVIHIGSNMLALFFIGRALEPALGSLRLGLIYFVSLAAGSLGVIVLEPDSLSIGASGAIFGLMGAFVMFARVARHQRHAERHRAGDPAQPGDHVHDPGHLDRRRISAASPAARRIAGPHGRARQAPPRRASPRRSPRSALAAFVGAARRSRSRSRARSTRAWADALWTRSRRSPAASRPSSRSADRASWRSPSPCSIAPAAEAFFAARGARAPQSRRTSCPPSACATARRSRATPASRRAARARRSWPRSAAPACTTSPPSSCAGTAAPTSASAASCAPTAARSPEPLEGAPTVRCERAAEVRRALRPRPDRRRHALRDDPRRARARPRLRRERRRAALSACRSRAATPSQPACATRRAAP